jgi:hypothetical protein
MKECSYIYECVVTKCGSNSQTGNNLAQRLGQLQDYLRL